MKILQNLSIKNKLVLIISGITSFLIFIGFSFMAFMNVSALKEDTIKNADLQTQLFSQYLISPLVFNKKSEALEIIKQIDSFPSVSDVLIFNSDKSIFVSYHKNEVDGLINAANLSASTRLDDDYIHIVKEIQHQEKNLGYIYIRASTKILADKINSHLFIISAVLVFLLIASYLLASKLQKIISVPVLRLSEMINKITTADDYSLRIDRHGKDEIGKLYDGFNSMLETVYNQKSDREKALQELRENDEKIRAIFNQTLQFIALLDVNGIVLESNKTFLDDFNLEIKDILHKPLWENLWWNNSAKRENELKQEINKAAEGKIARFEIDYKNNGSLQHIDFSIKPVLDQNGLVSMLIAEGRDFTERKVAECEVMSLNITLEQRVMDRTAQLEAANKELEAFSYSVSHDLRAPLRSIDGFSLALVEDYVDILDEQGKDYIYRVRKASQKMGGLIDDLLNLSRISRKDLIFSEVNLSNLAKEIAGDLRAVEPDRQVKLCIDQEVIVNGDEKLLKIVMQNLLSNAWKFTRDTKDAEICFTTVNENTDSTIRKQVCLLKDNGAGFDTGYSEKLFGAFQRLHTEEEFEGTGIGLATVKRIINKHGGAIWAEAKVNKGASFYFTLD